MTFEESDLIFNFSREHWQIKKYDTHKYFKILSGAGLKGVDFLGIWKNRQVVFFEVKHFHTNSINKPPKYSIFEDTPSFTNKIIRKLEDSLLAVEVIHKYLLRKWWFRLFLKWKPFIPQTWVQNRDWYFWYQVNHLSKDKDYCTLVLWLEIDHHYAPISRKKIRNLTEKQLTLKLNNLLGQIKVANQHFPVYENSLMVKALPN